MYRLLATVVSPFSQRCVVSRLVNGQYLAPSSLFAQCSDTKRQPLMNENSCSFSVEQRRFRSNRSRRGLYDGKDIRTGNNLSFSMRATKRKFKPNVFVKRVYSEILDEMVRFHLTTSALRSIDKMGGLDNYLLTSPHVTSGEGLQVKKRIVNKLKYRERHGGQNTPNSSSRGE
jgi:large subunit ribosomal protein L28